MEITASILRPEIKVVVLDLDGTIYDKRRLGIRMFLGDILESPLLAKERRVRKAMRGQWYGSREAFYDAFFANMIRHRLCTINFMKWWYHTCYMPLMVDIIRRKYRPRAWVIPFLEQCHALNIRVVILSDYDCVEAKLTALGIEKPLYDWAVSAPTLGGLKPAQQLMDAVTSRMQVAPFQCMVIGDRQDTDGAMACAAGAGFVLVK